MDADRAQLEAERVQFEGRLQKTRAFLAHQPGIKVQFFDSRNPEVENVARDNATAEQQFERATRTLLSTYGNYNDANRSEFTEQLTKVVTQHFDFKQSVRERELKQLEEQLAKLKALHSQRTNEKNEIIRDRVRQLTREAAGLGWGGSKPSDDQNIGAGVDPIEEIFIHRDDELEQ